jgi:hypothetical protein
MIDARDVTAIVVTRGDVDLEPVVGHLPFDEVGIWDNSVGEDLSVYGRYEAIERIVTPVALVCDDDAQLPVDSIQSLLKAYVPGHVTANMPREYRDRYTDNCLVGFGAIFDADLPAKAFARFRARHPHTDEQFFRRTCDVVFTALTPRSLVDLPFTYLPHTWADNRMYRAKNHSLERRQMLELAKQVK